VLLQNRETSLRRRLSAVLDDDAPPSIASHIFNTSLAILIIANVIIIILESVEPLRMRYETAFSACEHVATAIFAVEYVLRAWTCVDYRNGLYSRPVWGRLRYLRSFFAIVDLLSVLPALLGFFGAGDLRILRLLRLLRMLKLTRHSTVFRLLWAVFHEEAPAFLGLLFIMFLALTMSAALMYIFESEEQPAAFSSIPAAMWWAIETLTTVGYGDMVPMTTAGRILGGIISIVGIATLALFSGLVTVGYLERLRALQLRLAADGNADGAPAARLLEPVCPHCGRPLAAPAETSAGAVS
jgi:voltage-gated potassium channel